MNVPPPRVVEVLSPLRDLSPEQARGLLTQVTATLDAAEVLALRQLLPPSARRALPSCVGAVTLMNDAPMPWEFVEPPPSISRPAPVAVSAAPPPTGVDTGRMIAEAMPSLHKRRNVTIAVVCVLGLGATLRWGSVDAASLVPPPPAREYSAIAAPPIVPPARLLVRKNTPQKAATKTPTKTATKAAPRSKPTEWASPFERRH